MNSVMHDNGAVQPYTRKNDDALTQYIERRDEVRNNRVHNAQIHMESRSVWKEAYMNFHHIPNNQRPTRNTMYLTATQYADLAAQSYIEAWEIK